MRLTPRRVVRVAFAALAGVTYLWIAAVRATPTIRRRKAEKRQRLRNSVRR